MENRNKSDSRVDCWQVFDSWVCLISQMIEFDCWKIQFHVDMLETLLRADFVEQECISISSHVTSIVSGPTLALVSETLWELLKNSKALFALSSWATSKPLLWLILNFTRSNENNQREPSASTMGRFERANIINYLFAKQISTQQWVELVVNEKQLVRGSRNRAKNKAKRGHANFIRAPIRASSEYQVNVPAKCSRAKWKLICSSRRPGLLQTSNDLEMPQKRWPFVESFHPLN